MREQLTSPPDPGAWPGTPEGNRKPADREAYGYAADITEIVSVIGDTRRLILISGGLHTVSASLSLSQEELASLIGAFRSTITRALYDWRSRNIIRTDQRDITILDRALLLRIACRSAREPLSAYGRLPHPRIRRRNADHRAEGNASTSPDGSRESRTSTDGPSQAISTH
jgi:Crp-like helix-turn-helix protein